MYARYGFQVEKGIAEYNPWTVGSIKPLREAIAKKCGLPADHMLFFGVSFAPVPRDIHYNAACDYTRAEVEVQHRQLISFYGVEIYREAKNIKEWPGIKGYWSKVAGQ